MFVKSYNERLRTTILIKENNFLLTSYENKEVFTPHIIIYAIFHKRGKVSVAILWIQLSKMSLAEW